MASRTCGKNGHGGRPWQRPLDSQDFGFSSNLMDLGDVAPADELFFKGQLLPLLQDPKSHFVQSLCCSSSRKDDDDEQALNPATIATARSDLGALAPSCDGDARKLTFCRPEQEDSAQHRIHVEALESARVADGTQRASLRKCTENVYGAMSWDEGKELNSLGHDLAMVSCKASGSNAIELRSSSFRSQNSGFWDSGTEKDAMDSSSSRDSNGSSQDSYVHSHITRSRKSVQASHPDHFHGWPMLGFGIPNWKSGLLSRGPLRKQAAAEDFPARGCSTPPSPEAEAALLPWMQQSSDKLNEKQTKIRVRAASPSSAITRDVREAKTMHAGRSKTKDPNLKKQLKEKASEAAEMKNQRSAAARKRWQMKLKPLCEMKVWMGQFGMMDDCGKRAYYEVEHGTISLHSSANSAAVVQQIMQRRPPHQRNSANFAVKNHQFSLPQPKQLSLQPVKSPAMSSCPSSTISSPNRSGSLDFLDTVQKIASSHKPANSIKKTHSGIPGFPRKSRPNACDAITQCSDTSINGCSSNYRSMSTMQELHSALQGAIAHCKESNKKLTMDLTVASK